MRGALFDKRLPEVCGVLATCAILVVIVLADYFGGMQARDQRMQTWLDRVRPRLETEVNERLSLVWGLEAFVKTNKDFTKEEFEAFAEALEGRWSGVRSVQLAPDGVIKFLSRPRENSSSLGINLFANMYWRPAVVRALRQREYVIAGPMQSAAGRRMIVGRMPVFVKDDTRQEAFWGFAQVVIDVDDIITHAGLNEAHEEFEFAMRGVDGQGLDGAVFLGEEAVFDEPTILEEIHLPGGSWYLATKAKSLIFAPWDGRVVLWGLGLAIACLCGAITMMLMRWPQRLRAAVQIATREVESSRQHYRKLSEVAPTGIYEADAEANISFANERLRTIMGVGNKQDIFDRTWDSVIHPDDRDRARGIWEEAVAHGSAYGVYRIRRDDGAIVWVLDRIMAVLRDESGRAVELIGALTDITQQKLAEEALSQAKCEAEQANKAKSEFLAAMSHEIRTPLNGVIGMLGAVLNAEMDDELRDRLSIAKRSADTLLELLNDALDLSKIEAGRSDVEMTAVDVTSLVREVADLWRSKAVERGLELHVHLDDAEGRMAHADTKRVRQIVSNLVSNAIKFTESGSVDISIRPILRPSGERALRIEVADTGAGIPESEHKMIFRKFDRRVGDSHVEGTGLGLAICQELVMLMGGEIGLSSTPGEGSRFWFDLKVAEEDAAVLATAARARGDVRSDLSMGSRPLRVLVAEDNVTNRVVISAILDQPDVEVTLAVDGRDAVERANAARFDVILMDIRMPELDGIEATQEIRAGDGASRSAPIIALTANAMDGERATYMNAGMNECITKPIDMAELFAAIARCTAMSLRDELAAASEGKVVRAG